MYKKITLITCIVMLFCIILVVGLETPSLNLTSSAGWTIPASTYSTINGTGCPAELTCNLYLSNVEVANPYTNIFSAGNYLFIFNTTGNENYSSASVSNTLISQLSGPPECKYNKLGYYNTKIPWIRQTGCVIKDMNGGWIIPE